MAFSEHMPTGNEYNDSMAERTSRSKAIIAAHQKMIEAVHFQEALTGGGVAVTYKYVQFLSRDLGDGDTSFVKFSLRPKRPPEANKPITDIEMITFEMPIKPWNKADEFIQNMHLLSLSEYKDSLESSASVVLDEPLFAPDQMLLFSVYRQNDDIHGIIGESCYGAIEFMDDIVTSPIGLDGGLDYSIVNNADTSNEQVRLQTDWFKDIQEFTELINNSEPMTVDSRYNFGRVA